MSGRNIYLGCVAFLMLSLSIVTQLNAQIRLGLHVTQEELNIWRERTKTGPYRIDGDVRQYSPGDWTRILTNANAFIANPIADRWIGDNITGCLFDNATSDYPENQPGEHGKKLRDAALVYLITSDTRYLKVVRDELIFHASNPLNDFTNRIRFCDNLVTDAKPGFQVANWMQRLLIGYDYVKNNLSDADKQKLDTWFYNAAIFYQTQIDKQLAQNFVNRKANDWTLTSYANHMNSFAPKMSWYNGWPIRVLAQFYNNRRGCSVNFFTNVGIQQNKPDLIKSGKLFVKEWLMFGVYPDGTIGDFERGSDGATEQGWQYSMLTLNQGMEIADHLARTGDYELYNFTTSRGAYGSEGGNKNLLLVATHMCNFLDNTIQKYCTSSAARVGDSNYKIDGVAPLQGLHYVHEIWLSQPNIYFKSNYIKGIYMRTGHGTKPYPARVAGAGFHSPWMGGFGTYPAKMFLFAQMEGKVWPYPNSNNLVVPLSVTASSKDAKCNGSSDGTAAVAVSGGVSPYTYTWSSGQTTAEVSGLKAGSYTVTVTDKAGSKQSKTVIISQPTAISVVETVQHQTEASKGSISLTVSGGTGAYKYSWSNGATSKDLTNLSAGSYTVTVSDQNNCSTTKAIEVKYDVSSFNITTSFKNISCNGISDGEAAVAVSGGVSPYTYTWSSGQTTAEVSGLKAGSYTVTVTDKAGSKQSKTVIISQPTAISVVETVQHQTEASKGSISLTVSGGTGAYKYSWSNGATSKDLTNLSAGSYTVTVSDQNNCSTLKTVNIQQNVSLSLTVSFTNVTCYGANNGTAAVTASGGVSPYTYAWSSGQTTAEVSGLKAGSYTVIVTDKAGSKQSKTVTLIQPASLTITNTSTDETAAGKGSISLAVSGGTGAYKYSWSNGATSKDLTNLSAGSYTVTVSDQNNCTANKTITVDKNISNLVVTSSYKPAKCNGSSDGTAAVTVSGGVSPYTYAWSSGQTTAEVSGLKAGSYTVTVTDKAGSKQSKTVIISQPTAISVVETVQHQTEASKGSISLTVSGGTGAYKYSWSNGATSKDLTNLSAGSYTVTVSDQNNCSVIEIIDVKDNTSTSQLAVSNFSLIDADKNKIINEFNPLKNHDTLNLAKLPSRNLNIQANISSNEVGSVRFALNGNNNYSTDNAAPFYLAGGLSWTPTVGTYTLTATPINKSGIAGATSSIVLHVIDQADQPNLQDIKPILECVTDNGDGTLTATFGYLNNNAEEIIIAEGPSNNLNPLPLEVNIPEKFLPGRQHNVFSVKFSSKANLIWTLENLGGSTRTATANAGSEKCTSDGELSTQVKPRKIFSPNEDGIDDLWKIENIELYPEYEVVIFNRSGKKVFEAKPYTNNWDGRFAGTPLLSEAYYYVIKSANQGKIKSGSVTLIR